MLFSQTTSVFSSGKTNPSNIFDKKAEGTLDKGKLPEVKPSTTSIFGSQSVFSALKPVVGDSKGK